MERGSGALKNRKGVIEVEYDDNKKYVG